MGDIKLHLNKKHKPLIDIVDQRISALGLKQHVSEYAHNEGNILDAIITDIDTNYTHSCGVGVFFSDHWYVLFKTIGCKEESKHHKLEYRNIKGVAQ